jgi:ABC-type oligopeptide transport system ATPase subunit
MTVRNYWKIWAGGTAQEFKPKYHKKPKMKQNQRNKKTIEKFTYPGQRKDVNKTFVFHFSPPKATEEKKKKYNYRLFFNANQNS